MGKTEIEIGNELAFLIYQFQFVNPQNHHPEQASSPHSKLWTGTTTHAHMTRHYSGLGLGLGLGGWSYFVGLGLGLG